MKHVAPKNSGRHAAPSKSARSAPVRKPRASAASASMEIADDSVETPVAPRKRRKPNFIPRIIIAILLLGAIGGTVFAANKITNSPYNLPKVYVGDVFVGKMDAAQTKTALEGQGWKARATGDLTVSTIGGLSFKVDPVKSGMTLSVDDAVKLAHEYGHDGNMFENLICYVKNMFSPVEINSIHQQANSAYVKECIAGGIADINEHLGEAEYVVDYENATMTFMKGWGQVKFDEQLFAEAIISALDEGKTSLTYSTLSSTLVCPDFEAIHKELNKEVVNASYTDDGKFNVIDEVVGCDFDVAAAQQLWNEANPGDKVVIPLDVTWPEVTGEFLRGQLFRDVLGMVTTKFPNSGEQRRSNLKLATSKISGMILYPGDEFSFNTVVGKRTEEAGFLPAPAYVDGDVADEVGGGVCQVSSTLYAATAMAFLETVERECHYFPVNYMQMGSDATVTIPNGGRAIDFKFKNNKNFPIKIVGNVDNENSRITFQILGTVEEGDYLPVKFDNCYGWQFVDHIHEVEPAITDRPGYTIKLDHETYSGSDDVGNYYRTLTHRYVIDENGVTVSDEIINMKLKNGNFAMDTYYQH